MEHRTAAEYREDRTIQGPDSGMFQKRCLSVLLVYLSGYSWPPDCYLCSEARLGQSVRTQWGVGRASGESRGMRVSSYSPLLSSPFCVPGLSWMRRLERAKEMLYDEERLN